MLQLPEGRRSARALLERMSGARRRGVVNTALVLSVTAVASAYLPGTAAAAAPTPQSETICGGSLAKDRLPTADDPHLQWNPCPPFLPKGCQIAVLHGDPAKPNVDVFLKVPAERMCHAAERLGEALSRVPAERNQQ